MLSVAVKLHRIIIVVLFGIQISCLHRTTNSQIDRQIDHRDPCIFTKLQRLILRTVIDNDIIKIRRIFFDIRNCI